MKKFTGSFIFFGIAVSLMLNSCSSVEYFDRIHYKVEDNLQKGTWQITLFDLEGIDKTGEVQTFKFDFRKDNILTVGNSGVITEGYYDIFQGLFTPNILQSVSFNIDGFETAPLIDLNKNWEFISQSNDEVKLISGSSMLIFEKM